MLHISARKVKTMFAPISICLLKICSGPSDMFHLKKVPKLTSVHSTLDRHNHDIF